MENTDLWFQKTPSHSDFHRDSPPAPNGGRKYRQSSIVTEEYKPTLISQLTGQRLDVLPGLMITYTQPKASKSALSSPFSEHRLNHGHTFPVITQNLNSCLIFYTEWALSPIHFPSMKGVFDRSVARLFFTEALLHKRISSLQSAGSLSCRFPLSTFQIRALQSHMWEIVLPQAIEVCGSVP